MSYMSDDLKNLGKNLVKMVNAQKQDALEAGKRQADALGAESKITNNRYLDVTFPNEDAAGGVIDLKEGFAHGSKVRHKKNGGWYTIVPIRYKTSDMSKSTYKQVQNIKIAPTSTNYIDILYGGHPLKDASLSAFGVSTMIHGGNLTREATGSTKGNYYAFRTVSDKSSSGSWLLAVNRAQAQAADNEKLKKIGTAIQDALNNFDKGV